jgi:hypothetical protein
MKTKAKQMSFLKLPAELQALIWHFSLPGPRIVDLFAFSISETLQERHLPSDSCSRDAFSASWIRTCIERVYAGPQPLSPLLHVCRDSRALVLQRFVKLNADAELQGQRELESLPPKVQPDGLEVVHSRAKAQGNLPFALLDPKIDMLFLQDPQELMNSLGGPLISSLPIMLRWIPKNVIETLRSIAIPYFTWRKTRKAHGVESLQLLMKFKDLEELYVSFLGGQSVVQAHTWLDEVNGMEELGGHFREVEMEVLADVENLARKFPEWRRPVVRVVKHRSVLAREFEL